mmetsp:Transcript_110320/g.311922  ORF Transcript_110320/g.311922 Transcript_110320/m.311922 type:complete len:247 (+) Transcript_110320:383-1123(+)
MISRLVWPQRQSLGAVSPQGPHAPSWQARWHRWLQPSCGRLHNWPQSGRGSEQRERVPAQRTSIAAAASPLQRLVLPQAQRSPQDAGSREHGPHGPGWHCRSQEWLPQSSGLPQVPPHANCSIPQVMSALCAPQKQGCMDETVHAGHSPAWHLSGQLWWPHARGRSQVPPQDHRTGSPHLLVWNCSRPQWQRPGWPGPVQREQGPGWQSSGHGCEQPRLRSQTSPQLCASQWGLASGWNSFPQKQV